MLGFEQYRLKICAVKDGLFRKVPFYLCASLAQFFFACGGSVDEKEFLDRYQELSNRRIQFRLNMKALGDSTGRQRRFTASVIREAMADTMVEKQVNASYALWNDSLRKILLSKQTYFETQYSANRPLISSWEKAEMRLDGMVQRIKDGQLSETEGLDSMNIMLGLLDSLIIRTDTLLIISNRKYWDFRRNLEEYRYNSRNLKALLKDKKKRPTR